SLRLWRNGRVLHEIPPPAGRRTADPAPEIEPGPGNRERLRPPDGLGRAAAASRNPGVQPDRTMTGNLRPGAALRPGTRPSLPETAWTTAGLVRSRREFWPSDLPPAANARPDRRSRP